MRLLALFVALALAMLVPFALFGETMESVLDGGKAVAWLNRQPVPPWSVAFALLALDLVLPVPASAVMAALGVIYGPLLGGAIASAGGFCAGMLGYSACRMFGERAALFLLGEEDLRRGKDLFERAGGLLVAGSRALPLLPEVVSCVAGLLAMPLTQFAAALACGSLVMGFLMAILGHLGAGTPFHTILLATLLPVLLWFPASRLLRARS